jgi:protoporphyrinogen oxidase
MSAIDALDELVADVRRGALDEATAMKRVRSLVADPDAALYGKVQRLTDELTKQLHLRGERVADLVRQAAKEMCKVEDAFSRKGVPAVDPLVLAARVRELVEAQADLHAKRRELDAVASVLEGDA